MGEQWQPPTMNTSCRVSAESERDSLSDEKEKLTLRERVYAAKTEDFYAQLVASLNYISSCRPVSRSLVRSHNIFSLARRIIAERIAENSPKIYC